MFLRLMLVAALFVSQSALAQTIYRWVDADGVMHFTDDPAQIPTKARPGASKMPPQEIELVIGKDAPGDAATEVAAPKPAPEPARPSEPDPLQLERQWRSAFKVLNHRVEELESSLAAERKRLETAANSSVYNPMTGQYVPTNEAELIKERIRKSELELKHTQEELDDLERDASRNSIPREWRR